MPVDVSLLSVLLALPVLLLVALAVARRRSFVRALRDIPSPKALPILGNVLQLNCSLEEFFKKMVSWSKEFGDIYLLWVGLRPFVFLYRVEHVQPLLSSSQHIDKSLEYDYLKPWLGTGLIVSTGAKWHARRKLLTPTFHSELLRDYFEVAARQAHVFVSCLRPELENVGGFDILPYAKRAALDVICECVTGHQVDAQTNRENEYVLAVQSLTEIAQTRFTNIWIALEPIFRLTRLGKRQARALELVHGFVDRVIGERKAERLRAGSPVRRTMLDLLLEMPGLGERDVAEEVNTFVFAGHDTVGTSVAWILYALGRKPHYQERILQELQELEAAHGPLLSCKALQRLTWLDACAKEAWRLYPVAPLIARQVYSPITLDGLEIPSGATLLVNAYLLHRDPRFFPDPEEYKPERFLVKEPRCPSYAYVPFSAGSRNCIGSKFASMETKLTVLALLRAYRFRAVDAEDRLRLVSQLVLENATGIRLSIAAR